VTYYWGVGEFAADWLWVRDPYKGVQTSLTSALVTLEPAQNESGWYAFSLYAFDAEDRLVGVCSYSDQGGWPQTYLCFGVG
jgi:hypothetical protein